MYKTLGPNCRSSATRKKNYTRFTIMFQRKTWKIQFLEEAAGPVLRMLLLPWAGVLSCLVQTRAMLLHEWCTQIPIFMRYSLEDLNIVQCLMEDDLQDLTQWKTTRRNVYITGYLYWKKAQQRFLYVHSALFAQSIFGIMQKKWIKRGWRLMGKRRDGYLGLLFFFNQISFLLFEFCVTY